MLKCPDCGAVNLDKNKYCYACELELDTKYDKVASTFEGVLILWVSISALAFLAYLFGFIELSMHRNGDVDIFEIIQYTLITAIILAPITVLYMSPSMLGRHRSDCWTLFWVNLGVGWTIIGWILCIAWVYKRDKCVEYQTLVQEIRDLEYSIGIAADSIKECAENILV